MTDEYASLKARVDWLERKMIELLWVAISGVSLGLGCLAYAFHPWGSLGGWGDLGVAVAVWAITAGYLQRHEFRGLQHTSKADTTRVRHQLNVGADHPRPAADRAQARRFNRRSIFPGCPR